VPNKSVVEMDDVHDGYLRLADGSGFTKMSTPGLGAWKRVGN
jgi:hypothetical protein